MTNEQREAVDRLNKDKNKPLTCGDITTCFIDDLDTVLSLLKEQQEEIERLKTDNGNVWQLNANMSKRHLNDICKLKQKDKQIDLMTDFMYKTGTGRRTLSCMFRQNDECNENGCRYCIKQYFADKAKRDQ